MIKNKTGINSTLSDAQRLLLKSFCEQKEYFYRCLTFLSTDRKYIQLALFVNLEYNKVIYDAHLKEFVKIIDVNEKSFNIPKLYRNLKKQKEYDKS